MRYNPDFTIDLDERKIPLLFNSWTFRNYSLKKGVEFEQLIEGIGTGNAFRGNDLPDLLLLAARSYTRFNQVKIEYSEDDAYEWIDSMGGLNSIKLMDIYKVFVSKLLNLPKEKFDVLWNKANEKQENQEKKSETATELPGRSST